MTSHYTLMQKLDKAQMAGKLSYAAHYMIRQALRVSQMSGATLDSTISGASLLLAKMEPADRKVARRLLKVA